MHPTKVLCYARYRCIVTWMECFHTHFKCCTNFKSLIYGVPNADQPETAPQNHCKITCIRSDVVLSRSLIITTRITQLEHKTIYLQYHYNSHSSTELIIAVARNFTHHKNLPSSADSAKCKTFMSFLKRGRRRTFSNRLQC